MFVHADFSGSGSSAGKMSMLDQRLPFSLSIFDHERGDFITLANLCPRFTKQEPCWGKNDLKNDRDLLESSRFILKGSEGTGEEVLCLAVEFSDPQEQMGDHVNGDSGRSCMPCRSA